MNFNSYRLKRLNGKRPNYVSFVQHFAATEIANHAKKSEFLQCITEDSGKCTSSLNVN
jgi:hypothetical protein